MKIGKRLLSIVLCLVLVLGLLPTVAFAAGTKLETPQNLKLQGTVLSWDAVDNADFYGVTLYHPSYVYSIGSWQTDGTSINLYKYLKDGETYGATVIACSNGSYQISTPAEIPLTACTNAGVPIYRDVNVVNGTSSASTAYPGMSVRLEAKPAPDGMVFDRWELSGGYINIGYSDTDTVIYVQAICDNDINARATYKYQENVTSAFTVQPQGGAALVGEYFNVTYAMNFTPQGTVKVQVEGNTPGVFTDLKQGTIDSASVQEDSVVTKTFRIMASDGTRNIYSDEFVVSWEDGPRFISQPMGGTVDHNVDFVATYALNFTPFSCRVERYSDYLYQWGDLSNASATQATISAYDFNTSSKYRIKAIIEGGGEVYSDEFTVTWSDAVSKFIQQPVGGTADFDEDFTFTFAINFTPASNIAIQKYNSGFDSWDTVGYCTSLTSGTISGFASETTNKYRLEAYENGTPIHSNEFTVTWEDDAPQQPTTYTVTVTYGSGSGDYTEGTNVTITAENPPQGKVFDKWEVTGATVADVNSATTSFTMPANAVTATATYKDAPQQSTTYTVTVSADNAAYGNVRGGGTYNENALVTVTAAPNNGYQFVEWRENGQQVSTDASYTFTATANRTLVAVFEAIPPQQPTATLTDIKITTPPAKDTYTAGESFDPNGMKVTAYYSNQSSRPLGSNEYTYAPTGALTENDTLITVSYTENGITKTEMVQITVSASTGGDTGDGDDTGDTGNGDSGNNGDNGNGNTGDNGNGDGGNNGGNTGNGNTGNNPNPDNPNPNPERPSYPILFNPAPDQDDDGEPVTAPKTFDGGTALYVGLTILSATGSAWLIRKKED